MIARRKLAAHIYQCCTRNRLNSDILHNRLNIRTYAVLVMPLTLELETKQQLTEAKKPWYAAVKQHSAVPLSKCYMQHTYM